MNKDPEPPKNSREKETQDDALKKVEIKNKEKTYLDGVFNYLCNLEQEPSSDENSKEKKYKKQIEEKVKEKKMNIQDNHFKSKTLQSKNPKKKKQYQEDKENIYYEENNEYQDSQKSESHLKKRKFGVKALRKVLRKLTNTFNKDEIKLMIWEVDSNLDGFVSFDEYEKMYKRCVIDQREREPKKLYYLIQFLMFDKDQKNYITIEDTLEVLCVRNTNGIDAAIDEIFDDEKKDEKGNIEKTGKKNETLTYQEFSERMHSLSLRKRTMLMNKKKIFCEKIKEEAIKNRNNKY